MDSDNTSKEESNNEIIQQSSLEELNDWIFGLNEIAKDCNDILNLGSKELKDSNLRDQFVILSDNNAIIKNVFLEYRNVMDNYIECIDLDCDLFYENEHKKNRELYLEHRKNFKNLKSKIF